MTFFKTRLESEKIFSNFGETVVLSTVFVSLLYFFSDQSVTKLDSFQDLALLFLALITLFNGTFSGVLSLSILAFGLYFYTFSYDVKTILEYLVFILLFGEFHFHFGRKNRQDKEEKVYLKEKFRELSNAFFALKISHDQLEKGYLLKPVTLRSLIIDLSKYVDEKESFEKLFETFVEAFSLKAALFCEFDEDLKVVQEIPLGDSTVGYDKEHHMVVQATLTKEPVFLAQSSIEMMEKEPVLAVLPLLDSDEDILGIYIIQKMDFLEFNKDNILKIQILLEYLIQERAYNRVKTTKVEHLAFSNLDARFVFEINRLKSMYKHFDINSSFLIVRTKEPTLSLVMDNFRQKKMRLLDMVDKIEKGDEFFYLFLLPLERVSGAVSFKSRVENELKNFSKDEYEIVVSDIKDIEKIENWMSDDKA